ncbi:monocarboxylate transporter 12 [Plakobranchus ocellatus]|uniref:Monocarboxylate transporter 12 n=1 Tax=Plakobranchus ocellatus TaxID=259542 RepID=A0AAV3ZDJ8_9GAST|nr:monocarboxylate transporter 12 [Plakobranchus ocellatus]
MSTSTTARSVPESEQRWRWVVLGSSFFVLLMNAALSYHVGVLNFAVSEAYEAAPETVSWLMAMYASLFALSAPIGSAIINVSSCRTCVFLSGLMSFVGLVSSSFVTRIEWLFLTLTISGLGQSLAQVGGNMGLAFYFPTKTALASGIAITGCGLGNFVHPALFQLLVEEYNIHGAFLILGALCLQTSALGLLMRPTAEEIKRNQENYRAQKSMSFRSSARQVLAGQVEMFKDLRFVQLLVAIFCFAVAFQVILVYFPEFLINSKGYSALHAATVASFPGIGTVCSRMLVGFAATDSNIGQTLMYVGMNLISFFLCITANTTVLYEAGAYFVAFAFGFYASGCQTLILPLTIGVLGSKKSASGYGIVLMVFGCGCLVGPPMTALALKTFGYGLLFPMSGVLFLVTAIVSMGTYQQRPHPEANGSINGDIATEANTTHALFNNQEFELVIPAVKDTDVEAGINCLDSQKFADDGALPLAEQDGLTAQPEVEEAEVDAEVECKKRLLWQSHNQEETL